MAFGLVLLAVLLPAEAAGAITGKPAVIDGDTIEIGGRRVELLGIDAPERDQTCEAGGRRWRCGWEAEAALAYFIGNNWVTCVEARPRQGNGAARCYAGGVGGPDIAAWMVARGWAMAVPPGSSPYAEAEAAARQGRLGLWRGSFVPPWEWRRSKRPPAASAR